MQIIKTAFITGCFGVDIIFYIENKQSYNYLKSVPFFCVTLYISLYYGRDSVLLDSIIYFFFNNHIKKTKCFLSYFRKQDKQLWIDVLYLHISTWNFLISTTYWIFDCPYVCLEETVNFVSRIVSKNTESCSFKMRKKKDELKSTCLQAMKQGYILRHKKTRNNSKFCVWTDN
jgi:hypothetical protein